jgi:hypothetical protein
MAASKKNKYIEQDLLWLKGKLEEFKSYVDSRPFHSLTDRMGVKMTKFGPCEYVIASVETQRKDLSLSLQEISQLLDAIAKLEEEGEKKKLLVRGNDELTPMESGEI